DVGHVAVPTIHFHPRNDVGGEVDDLLQVLRGEVEQVAEPGGDALEVPDVGDGSGQLDVAHAVSANIRPGDLAAAALAAVPLGPDALPLPALAPPAAGGA